MSNTDTLGLSPCYLHSYLRKQMAWTDMRALGLKRTLWLVFVNCTNLQAKVCAFNRETYHGCWEAVTTADCILWDWGFSFRLVSKDVHQHLRWQTFISISETCRLVNMFKQQALYKIIHWRCERDRCLATGGGGAVSQSILLLTLATLPLGIGHHLQWTCCGQQLKQGLWLNLVTLLLFLYIPRLTCSLEQVSGIARRKWGELF